jgi:mono/diheme cytochrome c family protein
MRSLAEWVKSSPWHIAIVAVLGGFLAIQLVPYGHSHANPPVATAVKFDSSRTQELVNGACADCHSNITSWPPESNVAPFSWLIQHDVDEGRANLNFSEWQRAQPDVNQLVGAISEGEMPPLQYRLLHPDARLSDAEKAALISGLRSTYAADPPGGG